VSRECFLRFGCDNVSSEGERFLDWSRLKPEEKVNMAIDMTDVVVRVCAEGIRVQYPRITEEELLQRLRERIRYAKR